MFCGSLFICDLFRAAAEVILPDGTVAGLPEKLVVMDSDGNSASSDTGEYFFYVENMAANESYSKNIQIMNLREDKAYHVYFYVEPVDKNGEIDLEEECDVVISLDGEQIYAGNVSGKGNVDLTKTPADLGVYQPGGSKNLNCSITWNGTDAGGYIDYGEKMVDKDGTAVVREGSGQENIYGEVTFKWIFYAVVDESYVPPKTGVLSDESRVYAAILAVAGGLIIIMLILLVCKKRNRHRENMK